MDNLNVYVPRERVSFAELTFRVGAGVNKKILKKMIRLYVQITLIVICLTGCNTSVNLFSKSIPNCASYLDLEKEGEVYFIKNKELRKISNLLKKNYNANKILQVVFFKPQMLYYCEIYKNNGIVLCLILDNNLQLLSEKKLQFDWKMGNVSNEDNTPNKLAE